MGLGFGGTGGVRDLRGPDLGGGLPARRSGPGEIGSIARQPRRLEVLEEVQGVSVGLWGWGGEEGAGSGRPSFSDRGVAGEKGRYPQCSRDLRDAWRGRLSCTYESSIWQLGSFRLNERAPDEMSD